MSTGTPEGPTDAAPLPAHRTDRGGWRSTSAQGLLLARWVAGEVAAARVDGFAWLAWVLGALGLAAMGLSIPVDPGWPLIALGALLVLVAVAVRLGLLLAVVVLRRLALPRRARHLRADAAAARGRLGDVLADAGVPVSLGEALGFTWALARGRRPHARALGDLGGLTRRLLEAAEIAHLRSRLAEAAGGAPPAADAGGDGPQEGTPR